MSKLDAVIVILKGARSRREAYRLEHDDLDEALRILESYPRWAPLIKAAEKANKKKCIEAADQAEMWDGDGECWEGVDGLRALVDAIPDKEDRIEKTR